MQAAMIKRLVPARWDGAGAGLRVITITGWGKEEKRKKKKHHNKSQQKQPICPTEKKSNHNEEEGEAQGTKLQRWVETNRDGMMAGRCGADRDRHLQGTPWGLPATSLTRSYSALGTGSSYGT